MCSMWVYVFNVFFVGLTRLHRGAKPSSVMVSFYLNLVNLVIPVFLVNLLILQDVVILLKKSGHRGLFGGPTHPQN